MNNNYLFQAILITVLLSTPFDFFAQRIENVHPEIEGEKIHIYYDLMGIASGQSAIVKVFLSTDGGKTYGEPLKSVAGDVGVIVGPGKDKCIIWDVFKEVDELVSVNVKFKVKADLLQSELNPNLIDQYAISLNGNLGTRFDHKSYGFNLKGVIFIKQLGLGVRGGYYRNFDVPLSDSGYYWGYAGAATIEYDFIRNPKYSLYPFVSLGQVKAIYNYKPEYDHKGYFKYSIYGTLGLGFDISIVKFLYFGAELEYYLSPWLDIVPSEENIPDEALDGLCIGFVVKFVINKD